MRTATNYERPAEKLTSGAHAHVRHTLVMDLEKLTGPDYELDQSVLAEIVSWTDLFQTYDDSWNRLSIAAPTMWRRVFDTNHLREAMTAFMDELSGISMRVLFNPTPGQEKAFRTSTEGLQATVHIFTKEFFDQFDPHRGQHFHRDPEQDILRHQFADSAFHNWRPEIGRPLTDRLADGEVKIRQSLGIHQDPDEILLLDVVEGQIEARAFEVPFLRP